MDHKRLERAIGTFDNGLGAFNEVDGGIAGVGIRPVFGLEAEDLQDGLERGVCGVRRRPRGDRLRHPTG